MRALNAQGKRRHPSDKEQRVQREEYVDSKAKHLFSDEREAYYLSDAGRRERERACEAKSTAHSPVGGTRARVQRRRLEFDYSWNPLDDGDEDLTS